MTRGVCHIHQRGPRRQEILQFPPARQEFSLLRSQLSFSTLKAARCADTKHWSGQVTGTDETPRLRDGPGQPLEEKPGGFKVQKGHKNKGQRKSCLPSRGAARALAPSCCPLRTHAVPGQGRQLRAGNRQSPAAVPQPFPGRKAVPNPSPCVTRRVSLSPSDYFMASRFPAAMPPCQAKAPEASAGVSFTAGT